MSSSMSAELKEGGGFSKRRSLLKAKLKLSRFTSCFIPFKRGEHSQSEGEGRVPRIPRESVQRGQGPRTKSGVAPVRKSPKARE
eukprot:582134-Pleurochrysis_carterae.AAC.1